MLPPGIGMGIEERRGREIQVRSSVQKQKADIAQLGRQQQIELFRTIHKLRATGMRANQIASHLGLNRRRIDRWLRLDTLPERNRMEPRPGVVESFRDYLQQRWEAGCRQGRTLLAEIRELGYLGAFSPRAHFLSPWRQPPVEVTTTSAEATSREKTAALAPAARQISPQVAAALLSKFRTDLTSQQGELVDTFKQQCPDFALMRELMLNFRSLFRLGKLAALHVWIERAQKTGIRAMTRFVRTLKQDLSAVEAAVTEP